ncbi:MAG: FkbM family methyltransferase [Hyphomicrobiaceae bacterium]
MTTMIQRLRSRTGVAESALFVIVLAAAVYFRADRAGAVALASSLALAVLAIRMYRRQLDQMQRVEDYLRQIGETGARLASNETQLADATAQLRAVAVRLVEAEGWMPETRNRLGDIDSRLGAAEAALADVSGSLPELRTQVAAAHMRLAGSEAGLAGVVTQLAADRARVDGLEASATTDRARLDGLEANATTDRARLAGIDAIGAELAAGRTRVDGLESRLAAESGRIGGTEAQLGELTTRLTTAETRLAPSTRTFNITERRLVALEGDSTRLRVGLVGLARFGRFPPTFYAASTFDPEADLLAVIVRHVASRRAIDVGANRGEFSAALRNAGFTVDAFEPLPELAAELRGRFADDQGVRIHQLACSDVDGSAELHLVESRQGASSDDTLFSSLATHPAFDGFEFSRRIEVSTRRLATVFPEAEHRAFGLLKTDAEGQDKRVLAGADGLAAEVLLVEFWDAAHVFNQGKVENTLADYLSTVDRTRYPHHIVMWRQSTSGEFGLAVDASETPKESWGNILFTANEALMEALVAWGRRAYGANRVDGALRPVSQAGESARLTEALRTTGT